MELVLGEPPLIVPKFDDERFCSVEGHMWSCPARLESQNRPGGEPMDCDGLSKASFVPASKWQLDKPRLQIGVAGSEADIALDGESEGSRCPLRKVCRVEVTAAVHNVDTERFCLQI